MRGSNAKLIIFAYIVNFCMLFGLGVQSCLRNGNSFSFGDVWRENIHGRCKQCKCLQGGRIRCLPTCSRNVRFPLRPLLPHDLSRSPVRPSVTGLQCMLDGKTRRNGESWTENSAHSRSLEMNRCMECNCKAQVITCAIRKCPTADCARPIAQQGTCCKTCQERSARPPRQSSNRGCLSIGRNFQDEETWQLYLPSPNVFATCVDCSCKNGREYCSKHLCPLSRCSNPVKRPGDCCSFCPGHGKHTDANRGKKNAKSSIESGIFGFLLRPNHEIDNRNSRSDTKLQSNVDRLPKNTKTPYRSTPNKKKGCHFGVNLSYKHNELFYPVLNKRTQICTKCVCKNSIVNCARIRCPTRYPCRRPVRKDGFCCKVCHDMSDKEARKLEAIQMYQNMGCSKAKRNQLQVYRYSHVGSSAAQLSARYLFDKSHQPNKKTSEIHHLNMIHMKINITRKFIDSDDVTRNSLDKDWQYLGAIKEKMFARVLRLERDLKNCKDPIRCIRKLTNLVDQVKTKAAKRRRCKSNPHTRLFRGLQK